MRNFVEIDVQEDCLRAHLFCALGAKKKNTNKIRQVSGTYILETTGAISFKFGM